jgi:hypothetical protein
VIFDPCSKFNHNLFSSPREMSFIYKRKSRKESTDRLDTSSNEILGSGGGSFSSFHRTLSKNEDSRAPFREKQRTARGLARLKFPSALSHRNIPTSAITLVYGRMEQSVAEKLYAANYFITLKDFRYNVGSNEKNGYFPTSASQGFAFYKSVVYGPLGIEVGSLFWELTTGVVRLAVFMLLSVLKQPQNLAS